MCAPGTIQQQKTRTLLGAGRFRKLPQFYTDSALSCLGRAMAAPGVRAIGIQVESGGFCVHNVSVNVAVVSVGKLDGPCWRVKNFEVKIP
jgi:hypothetical protein